MSAAHRLEGWLASRAVGVPASLWERIRQALSHPSHRSSDGNVSAVLRTAADDLLHEAKGAHDALALLAADALITFACEAAAEEDASQLARLR